MCVLAGVGASLAVWSCSTEMSADLCYSRGIRESVRHQKTPRLLDSIPPEHPSSFHSSSYRTLHLGRGFPSYASERVTITSLCDTGFSCICFPPHPQHKHNGIMVLNFSDLHRKAAAQSDCGINLHYINQLYIHTEWASSPDMCDAAHFTQRIPHVHGTQPLVGQLELNWHSFVSRQFFCLDLHMVLDFDLI